MSARGASRSPRPIRSGNNTALSAYLAAHGFEIVRAEGKDVPFSSAECYTCRHTELWQAPCSRVPALRRLYLPCPQCSRTDRRDAGSGDWHAAIAYTHQAYFVAFKALGIKDIIRRPRRLLASLAETKQ